MTKKDVTDQVIRGAIDEENMFLLKCICGYEFAEWNMILGTDPDPSCASPCINCGRKFFFQVQVKVLEIREGGLERRVYDHRADAWRYATWPTDGLRSCLCCRREIQPCEFHDIELCRDWMSDQCR